MVRMHDENIFKSIPQVESLLQNEQISVFIPALGRGTVIDIIREEVALVREKLKSGQPQDANFLTTAILRRCAAKKLEKLQRVINGTGVIIHTNLGRAPLSAEVLDELRQSLCGYCNLELHLPTHARGRRGGFAEELLRGLTVAEDALIVNNNASSVFLILHQFARGRDVIVSRGELVQIGGGFRIPDIMRESGARLVETGTTNITELADYRNAINDGTAMIFSVHRSNFRMEGFTRGPSLRDLASLKSGSLLLVRDLGSGNLVRDGRLPVGFEPTVADELAQGADLVCFSGDKLLGGCQAGIIVGRKDLIAKLRKNPLMRMLRVDKITYFLLQQTLLRYANGAEETIGVWDIIFQDITTVSRRIDRVIKMAKKTGGGPYLKKISVVSTYGGGAMPSGEIESAGLRIVIPGVSADEIFEKFIGAAVPIVGYIKDDAYTLDFRTITDDDIRVISDALREILPNDRGAR